MPIFFRGSIILEGAGAQETLLDGEEMFKIMQILGEDGDIQINNLAIINGDNPSGAGLIVTNANSLEITNCRFDNNNSSIGGGVTIFAIDETTIDNCQFDGNNASVGAAIQYQTENKAVVRMDITNSTFSNNTGSFGSAIQFQASVMNLLTVDRCQFIDNQGSFSTASLNFDSLAKSNTAQITNSLFINNTTALSTIEGNLNVINNTFVNNRTALIASANVKVVNSLFWNNQSNIQGTDGVVSFSLVEDLDIDGYIDGGSNIDLDPLLNDDFRISVNSPAIDMGDDSAIDTLGLIMDIDGKPRKFDRLMLNRPEGIVDIGANEIDDLIFMNDFE